MYGSNFMQGWVAITGSVAMIALILTAFGLTLGIVKLVDSLKRLGAILCIVIVLLLVAIIIVSAWSGLSLWQRLGLGVFGICLPLLLQAGCRPRNRHNK
jgi:hypothetical protein